MSKPSAFQQLLAKADETGRELCARYADRYCFPLPGTGAYRDVVSYAVLLYLSSWMRWDKSGQMTIYRYAKEYFQGDPDEKRVMYAHEKALLRQSDSFAEGDRRVYDRADFCLFTNSMAHSDPLLTYAVRQTLPFSKYVDDPAFAEAYRKYDEEYARAARITDAVDYVAASVHLFRKEYGFAFSIIAQIARYMSEHGITRFEREPGSRFWSNVLVEDFATGEMLSAPPDVLHYGVYVPFLFDGPVPGQIRGHYMQSEFAARTLYQNIYTRLPFPQEGEGSFEWEEAAAYIRNNCPIIENHVPVSFYQDQGCEKPDKSKIRLARKVMKSFISSGKSPKMCRKKRPDSLSGRFSFYKNVPILRIMITEVFCYSCKCSNYLIKEEITMETPLLLDPIIPFTSPEESWNASRENRRELERLTGKKINLCVLGEPLVSGADARTNEHAVPHAAEAVGTVESKPEQSPGPIGVDLTKAFASVQQTLASPSETVMACGVYPTPRPLTAAAATAGIHPARGQAPTTQNVTPYGLMKKTVSAEHIVVDDKEAYRFNGCYYERTGKEDLDSLILDICRKEIEKDGAYNLVTGARHFLMAESQVRKIDWTDQDSADFLTFRNGNLNTQTGQFFAHSPGVFTTYMLSCNYLGAGCTSPTPTFDRMLERITGGDPGMTERLWQIFGYCLVPDISAKKGFLFQGVGDSGKTMLSRYLSSFFPPDRVTGLSIHELEGQYAASELENVSLCISGDLPAEALKSKTVGMIKALSGADLVSGNRKYKSYSKFYFKGKFLMVSNHALLTRSKDAAFEKRIVAVPFCYTVPEEEQNPKLLQALALERDAVASKAIDAYVRLRQNHYRFAGQYELNSAPVLYQFSEGGDMAHKIRKFLYENYEACFIGETYAADAHALYCRLYGDVPYNSFAKVFKSQAVQQFGAREAWRRRDGGKDPVSCLAGMRPRVIL